jgi:dCTP deaminase
MILSDTNIRARCDPMIVGKEGGLIWPYDPKALQPASVDLTLDKHFLKPGLARGQIIDLADVAGTVGPTTYTEITATELYGIVLPPHQFILGSTAETVNIPSDLVASIEGKSSLARLGLFVHVTAGFIDPGFRGKVTLELFNANERWIRLRPGLHICQIAFTSLSSPAARPYGSKGLSSHYQDQTEVTSSRYEG